MMLFPSLTVIASVAALVQGAPVATKAKQCTNVKGASGYLKVYAPVDGGYDSVSLNKAKHVYYNPTAKKHMKVQFQYCSALGKASGNENGPIYKGRMLVPEAGKNQCLTVVGGSEPYTMVVQPCKSSTAPKGGQQWLSYGEDDFTRLYSWNHGDSGHGIGYRTGEGFSAIWPLDGTNYVAIGGCEGQSCPSFLVGKTVKGQQGS